MAGDIDTVFAEASLLSAVRSGDRAEVESVLRGMTWAERRELHDAALDLIVMINKLYGSEATP